MRFFTSITFTLFILLASCTNRDGEIIDLINSVKKQNDDLKTQITALKKTTDSALVAVLKVSTLQASTDKRIDLIQTDLKSVLSQIASISSQMTSANADLVSLKAKIDALQVKCAELVAQIATLTGSSAQINLKEGLLAYYPFNGNADDLSGNGNHGKVNGATLTSDRTGLANRSYNFNVKNWSFGSGGDNIYIPNNPSFNFSEFTISTWVKRTSDGSTISPQALTIIKRFQYGYSKPNGETWILQIEHGTSPTGAILYGSVIEQSPSPATNFFSTSKQIIPLNKWCHIIMTYSKKTINLYINNQLVGSALNPNININTNGTSGISIGLSEQANGQWAPFDGSIDDVGIWKRALTIEEIKFLYDNDFKP